MNATRTKNERPQAGRNVVAVGRMLACGQMATARRRWRAWIILLAAGASGLGVIAQETNSAAKPDNKTAQLDYSSFRIITERNIFAARRSGRTTRGGARIQRQVETFTLVGTLDSDKGRVAFFDGTSPEYRKALKPEGTIAGYKVTGITLKGVTLETGTNAVELRVGTPMRRQDDGEWRPGEYGEVYASAGESATSSSADPSGAAESGASGAENDVLKKLMQQREQESK